MAIKVANNQSLTAITALPAAVSGGAMTLLETQTASSSSTISFTSGIDSTYDEYVFKFIGIHPSTNYRFTPSTAGHYYIFARVAFDNDSASSRHAAILQKNGSEIARGDIQFTGNYFTNNNTSIQVDYIIEFNGSSDYVEVSGYSEVAGDTKNTDGYGCFGGFLIKAT